MNSPKGAAGYVLAAISASITEGNPSPTYLELSLSTGYSLSTVQQAVRRLVRDHFLHCRLGGCSRPNRYSLVAADRRRTIGIAQTIGLIH